MKCFICLQAETLPGLTSVLLERDELNLTIHRVPARICPNCGEAYVEETVAANLLRQGEMLAHEGGKVEAREYEGD